MTEALQTRDTGHPTVPGGKAAAKFWPEGWWKLMDTKIGIIPVPIYVILVALLAVLVAEREIKPDAPTMILVLVLGGFTCAEIGKRLPILRNIGAGAIFATFIPSALVYYHLIPPQMEKSIIDFTKFTNFLYLYIASIIVGSILGMDRDVADQGLPQDFRAAGRGIGRGRQSSARSSARFSASAPITRSSSSSCRSWPAASARARFRSPSVMRRSWVMPQGDLFAQVLPPVMLGSLTAIIFAGTLNFVGKKYPKYTGEGRLQPDEHDDVDLSESHGSAATITGGLDVATIAAAGLVAIALYLLGVVAHHLVGLPAPVAMLFLAVVAKLTMVVSPRLQQGGYIVYKFVQVGMTYPLLFAIGVSLTPWDKLMAAFTLANLITIVATVCTLMATGCVRGAGS